jgi:hypothetical protein
METSSIQILNRKSIIIIRKFILFSIHSYIISAAAINDCTEMCSMAFDSSEFLSYSNSMFGKQMLRQLYNVWQIA